MSNVYYERMRIVEKMDEEAKIRQKEIRIGFIGAGRVGTAFAVHCAHLGFEIAGVYDINQARVDKLARLFQIAGVSRSKKKGIEEIAASSNALFLTVPDKNIKPVFQRVKKNIAPATIVIHCAGAFGIEVFGKKEGQLELLALHPIQTFLNFKQAIAVLPKSYFALEGTKKGLQFGKRLVRQLKGKAILIKGKDRPLYHSMCIFASNFINGLFEATERIGKELGFSQRQTLDLLFPLAIATLHNIREKGAVVSLTGPVKRKDRITVRHHLQALKDRIPELVPIYWQLTQYLTKVNKEKGNA